MKRNLIFFLGVIAATVFADPVAEPKPAIPGKLRWLNGETIAGELMEASATTATWKSSLFEDPLVLEWQALRRIDQPLAPVEAGDPFHFVLRDGSFLSGELLSITDQSVSIRSRRHGEAVLKRSELLSLRRVRGGNLVWAGPAGDVGWSLDAKPKKPGDKGKVSTPPPPLSPLTTGSGGTFLMRYWNCRAFLSLNLPELVDVEFHVRSSARPDFQVFLHGAAGEELRIETWDDELVLVRKEHFKRIRKIDGKERDLAIRLCWDRAARKCTLFTPGGEPVVEWAVPEEAKKAPPGEAKPVEQAEASENAEKALAGITLVNKGRDLSLERLRVRTWDGKPPGKVDLTQPRIELADGRVMEGRIGMASLETIRVESAGTELALSPGEVDAVIFSPDRPRGEEPQAALQYSDGTLLRGRIFSIAEGRILLETSFAGEPFASRGDGLRQLLLNFPSPEGPAPEKPFAGLDKMMADQSTFHGRVTGSDDASPRWWPVGGVRASTLRKDVRSEITRVVASNADFANPPALFHTSAGDVLPGNLRLLDRSGVEFESSVIESTRLAAGQVEAIQFGSANASHSQGFDSPLWKVLKGTEKTVEKSPNKVRMKPETSIGHSTALQGGQIGFSIANTGMSTLRLRLFCAGTDSARCPTLILSHWGNRIYYGLETGEGQLNPQQIACTSTEALVRLVIGEKHLELFLNNLPVQKFVIPSDKRAGSGLIFEPAGMWGNSVNAIELSDFSMTSEPGQIWLPDVAAEARMHALTVPRFRKEDLPRHALLAANGDVLRGEIEAVTPTHFGFRSGLEKLRIPRERVKAAIWLKKPLVEGPPREVHPVQKRLEEPFNHHIRYSQADLKTMIGVIKGQMGDLVFKLPEKADSRKFPMQFGGQAVGDLLDEICGLFDLRYRVDSAGVIVIEPLSRLSKDLLPKSYWIKADTLPEPALIQGMVEGKGISFPPGASLHWQPQGMQLSMTNTAANHQKLAALIDTEWGGSLGSPTHWLLLANGARFSLAVERFGSDFITGSHPLYGRCKVPLSQLCQIRTAMPESGAGLKALSHWHLRLAPEPVLPETGGESSAALGKEAKPFKLPLLEGGDFDLAQQKGKIVVLDFWATWCGPCIKSLPGLIEAMAAFPAEQVKLIGVNQSEPADQVKRFLETRKWKLSVAMDAGQGVSRQYGVDGIPHTVVIGPDGKVAWVKTGYSAQAAMETADAVRKLLAPPASN